MGTSATRAHPVIFLPGILMPAALRYERLVTALGGDVRAIVKDLEIYRGPSVPPPGYRFATEVEGTERAADESGFDRFHLYGHSAGGACALAFVAEHADRLLTLALDEPATDFSPEDLEETRAVYLPLLELPQDEPMRAFTRTLLPEGVEPSPSPEEPPPWMADRFPGVAAFARAMCEADVAFERLGRFDRPVHYSYGTISNATWERKGRRLAAVFPNLALERYDGLSHLNTSHIAEPERVAAARRPTEFDVDGRAWSGGMGHTDPHFQTWESSAAQPGTSGLITVYAGGATGASWKADQLHAAAPDAFASEYVGMIDEVVPGTAGAFNGQAWLDLWTRDPWTQGSYAAFLPGQFTRFWGYTGRSEGAVRFAGEHTSTHSQGYLNGGVESGQREAIEVLRFLGRDVPPAIADLPYSRSG